MAGETDERPIGGDLKALSERALLYFSAIAGLSFAVSALVHELVFATWGLDFTAIASTGDVVMGGFRMLAIFVPVFLILATFTAAVSAFSSTRGRFRNRGWWRFFAVAIAALLVAPLAAYSWTSGHSIFAYIHSFGPYRLLTLGALIAVWGFALTEVVVLGIPVGALQDHVRANWKHEFGIAVAYSTVVLFVMLSYTSYLNLHLAEGSIDLPDECHQVIYTATDEGYKIRWIGSDAMVLSCGHSWVVILNVGDNATLVLK